MGDLLASNLIPDLERSLRRVTLDGGRVGTDTEMQETALAQFSNSDLIKRLEFGAQFVAAQCATRHLGGLQSDLSPSNGTWDLTGVLRLLGSRVDISGTSASRRTFSDHQDKENSTGLEASDSFPAYVFEDAELLVAGGAENPATASARVVKIPQRVVQAGNGSLDGSGTLTISSGATLNSKHEETIATVDTEEVRIISVTDGTTAQVDSDSTASGTVKLYEPAFSQLGDRFHWALVHFAEALCHASLGGGDQMDNALSVYQREVGSYLAPQFDLKDL